MKWVNDAVCVECFDLLKTIQTVQEKIQTTADNDIIYYVSIGPFQKCQMWHLKDRKLIFYVKGKEEIMKVEIIEERDKGFMCLIYVMICDKKLGLGKQFHTVPDMTCKKAAILNSALSVQISMKKRQS